MTSPSCKADPPPSAIRGNVRMSIAISRDAGGDLHTAVVRRVALEVTESSSWPSLFRFVAFVFVPSGVVGAFGWNLPMLLGQTFSRDFRGSLSSRIGPFALRRSDR